MPNRLRQFLTDDEIHRLEACDYQGRPVTDWVSAQLTAGTNPSEIAAVLRRALPPEVPVRPAVPIAAPPRQPEPPVTAPPRERRRPGGIGQRIGDSLRGSRLVSILVRLAIVALLILIVFWAMDMALGMIGDIELPSIRTATPQTAAPQTVAQPAETGTRWFTTQAAAVKSSAPAELFTIPRNLKELLGNIRWIVWGGLISVLALTLRSERSSPQEIGDWVIYAWSMAGLLVMLFLRNVIVTLVSGAFTFTTNAPAPVTVEITHLYIVVIGGSVVACLVASLLGRIDFSTFAVGMVSTGAVIMWIVADPTPALILTRDMLFYGGILVEFFEITRQRQQRAAAFTVAIFAIFAWLILRELTIYIITLILSSIPSPTGSGTGVMITAVLLNWAWNNTMFLGAILPIFFVIPLAQSIGGFLMRQVNELRRGRGPTLDRFIPTEQTARGDSIIVTAMIVMGVLQLFPWLWAG